MINVARIKPAEMNKGWSLALLFIIPKQAVQSEVKMLIRRAPQGRVETIADLLHELRAAHARLDR